MSASFLNRLSMSQTSAGYRPADFRVQAVYFRARTARIPASYWAQGVIDGQKSEQIPLRPFLPREPQSSAELEQMVAPGSVLKVLYNPQQPAGFMQGESRRIVKFDAEFATNQQRGVLRTALRAFAPLALCLFGWLVYLVSGRIQNRR